ncbi:MAG: hypothetical protein JNM06_18305 [Blastocatellia bacterium]|nr:hypothetical protein [Blastocatellia bacterium]
MNNNCQKTPHALLQLSCLFWLTVVTPLLGILPLLLMFPNFIPRTMFFLGLAYLRAIVCLFVIDPEPGTSDVGPPLTELGFITMLTIVFGIAALSIRFLWKAWKSRTQKTSYPSTKQQPTQ